VLCVSANQDLPQQQRRWIREKRLGVARPATLADCLGMLERKEAGSVLASEAEGRAALASLGLAQAVRVGDTPIGTRAIHIALAKAQPGSDATLAKLNAAIARLKKSGQHGEIVARHMAELQGK
jgi:ABC-type amino acid transport substrate-binding protein